MRIILSLALPVALMSFASTVHAAPIDSLPNFDREESFESITASTPNVSYYAPAKVLTYSADLLLPSGVKLAYLGEIDTVVCNYAVGSPFTSMGANGSVSSGGDVAFGLSYAYGNEGKVRIEFPQAVVAAGAYVTGSMPSVNITAYDAANNVIETRSKATVAISQWKNNFAGIVDPARTIRAIEVSVTGGAPVVDEVRFLTEFRTLSGSAPEPPGANCAKGGAAFGSGPDTNANGVLEASEFVSRAYACNGTDGSNGSHGASSLIVVTTEPAGTHCPNGGQKIEAGVDTDDDGQLDSSEVNATTYVCDGADGTKGADGAAGTNGSPGGNALISVTTEPAGTHCSNGGQKIEAGVDANKDGRLDAGEVTATTYVCNGASGTDGTNGAEGAIGPEGTSGCSATSGAPVPWELGIILLALPLYRRRRAAVLP